MRRLSDPTERPRPGPGRKKDDCERVADEVRAIGTDALIVMADVGDQAAVRDMADKALKTFGRIDALYNNAAIRPGSTFLGMTDDDLSRVMNVNCHAAVWLSRACLPGMAPTRCVAPPGGRMWPCPKHASWGLIKTLSREFGPMGVTANMISPGTFPDEDEDEDEDAASSERYKDLLKQIPVGRLGLPEDIAAVVGLLCSDKGGFINGQLIAVNGGVVG